MRGKKIKNEDFRKCHVNIRLSRWLIEEIDKLKKDSRGEMIEDFLIRKGGFVPPRGIDI